MKEHCGTYPFNAWCGDFSYGPCTVPPHQCLGVGINVGPMVQSLVWGVQLRTVRCAASTAPAARRPSPPCSGTTVATELSSLSPLPLERGPAPSAAQLCHLRVLLTLLQPKLLTLRHSPEPVLLRRNSNIEAESLLQEVDCRLTAALLRGTHSLKHKAGLYFGL